MQIVGSNVKPAKRLEARGGLLDFDWRLRLVARLGEEGLRLHYRSRTDYSEDLLRLHVNAIRPLAGTGLANTSRAAEAPFAGFENRRRGI